MTAGFYCSISSGSVCDDSAAEAAYAEIVAPCVKLHLRDGRTDGFAASVRPSVCHESQRRRHGVTAAIAVDVAVSVCPSVRPSVS